MQSIGPNLRWITGALVLGLALPAGCGGDDADDGASTGDSGEDSGTSGPSSATTPTSMTEPADDDVADDDDDGSSDSAGSSSGSADSSGGGSSDAGSSGDTGPTGCAALDQKACMADETCMPITGSPLVVEGDVVCQGEREFIECQDSMACAEIVTTACENMDSMAYQFGNACIPTGWAACDGPGGGPFPPC